MEAKAKSSYAMISPLKVRLIADEIRNQPIDYALSFLTAMKNRKKAVEFVEKTLKSAIANFSVSNPDADTENLFVKEISVDGGPVHKRIRPRAQGRAFRRLKRTSHITVVLSN